MTDQVANFIKVTVSTGYDASATSIALSTGEGSELPDPSGSNYNLIWYDSTNYPNPADDPNVEIVRVTAKTSDTITVTRNQESSGASAKNTTNCVYKMILTPTAKTITDLQAEIDSDITTHGTNTDAHHAKSHNVASHSDTTATGAELEELTDGSTTTLHDHSVPVHETSHKASGSDEILLDELGTPTDVTTLNSSTSQHGLLKKLNNNASNFMNGQGNWAAVGSTEKIGFPVEATYLPATNPAELSEEAGSGVYAGQSVLKFDDTTAEHGVFRSPGVIDYDGGDMVINMQAKPSTTPASAKTLVFHIYAVGIADSEAYDSAVTVDTGIDITFNFGVATLQIDMMKATATIDPANVADGDKLVLEFIRNVATDDLVGDGEMIDFDISYTRS